MLLGGMVFSDNPVEYAQLHTKYGFSAGYFPNDIYTDQMELVKEYQKELDKAGVLIAEVGAWGNNPLSKDGAEAKTAVGRIAERLAIAEEINANCCVNIVGYHNPEMLLDKGNFTKDFYEFAVVQTRKIVDAIKPKRTKMCFEIFPFSFLDSADSYIKFIKDLDRKEIAVHLDPINCISTVGAYFNNGQVMAESVEKLYHYNIRSIHMKDLFMRPGTPNVELIEARMGLGGLDFAPLYKAIARLLPKDVPIMIEHLSSAEEYELAAEVARKYIIAAEN